MRTRIKRISETTFPEKVLETQEEGRRPKGSPQNSCIDRLKEDIRDDKYLIKISQYCTFIVMITYF